MLELMLCSLLTILPDYLFRRYVQGKRIGREITLYTVWYELRWGITACLLLTVSLITLIFYYHPSTKNVTAVFRTVTILPEMGGRVAEVFVRVNDKVEAGQPLFRLDSSEQKAALETASRRIAEIDAETKVAADRTGGGRRYDRSGEGAYRQALDELDTKSELFRRNASVVSERELERLQVVVDGRQGAVDTALANKRPWRRRSPRFCPHKKPAPNLRYSRRRSSWTRPSCVPASLAPSNSSRCGLATSSTRCCAPPASSFPPKLGGSRSSRVSRRSRRR